MAFSGKTAALEKVARKPWNFLFSAYFSHGHLRRLQIHKNGKLFSTMQPLKVHAEGRVPFTDASDMPILIFDRSARMVHANAAAKDWLRAVRVDVPQPGADLLFLPDSEGGGVLEALERTLASGASSLHRFCALGDEVHGGWLYLLSPVPCGEETCVPVQRLPAGVIPEGEMNQPPG
jgi:hypothetical protein